MHVNFYKKPKKNYFFSNQLLDCILSPKPSTKVIPIWSQIGLSGMVLLFWSPPFAKLNSYSEPKSKAIFSKVLQTVLSSSIDKIEWYTDFMLETIKTRSAYCWNSFDPFKALWWSLFTITNNSSAKDFALLKHSICPLCIGLKYPDTIIPFFLLIVFLFYLPS